MGLSTAQMARMNSLLSQALALDPKERQRWLEALSPSDRDLANAEAVVAPDEIGKAVDDAFLDRSGYGASKGLNPIYIRFGSHERRNAIVDAARARLARRRDDGASVPTGSTKPPENVISPEEVILEMHEALLVLEEVDPRLARLAEMRYYGGYTEAEIAEALGVTERTVHRGWMKARVLLKEWLKTRG